MYRVLWRASEPISLHHPSNDTLSQSGTLRSILRETSPEAAADLPEPPASVRET